MTDYIIYSIENILTISKIMFDHSILLIAMISYENDNVIRLFENEKEKYERFLDEFLDFSNMKVTKNFIESEIFNTPYTIILEEKTCNIFKIKRDPNFTLKCQNLQWGILTYLNNELITIVKNFNNTILSLVRESLKILNNIREKYDIDELTLYFDTDFLTHLIEETKLFIYTLEYIGKSLNFTPSYIYYCEYYFNIFLKEHSQYLENMFVQAQPRYIIELPRFVNESNELLKEFDKEMNPSNMNNINIQTINKANNFASYSHELIISICHTKYYMTIVPLLYDHILREANYIVYQLNNFRNYIK